MSSTIKIKGSNLLYKEKTKSVTLADFTKSGFVKTDGSISANLAQTSVEWRYSDNLYLLSKINVSRIHITPSGSGSVSVVAFYDANKNFVRGVNTEVSTMPTAEAGEVYVGFSYYTGHTEDATDYLTMTTKLSGEVSR